MREHDYDPEFKQFLESFKIAGIRLERLLELEKAVKNMTMHHESWEAAAFQLQSAATLILIDIEQDIIEKQEQVSTDHSVTSCDT